MTLSLPLASVFVTPSLSNPIPNSASTWHLLHVSHTRIFKAIFKCSVSQLSHPKCCQVLTVPPLKSLTLAFSPSLPKSRLYPKLNSLPSICTYWAYPPQCYHYISSEKEKQIMTAPLPRLKSSAGCRSSPTFPGVHKAATTTSGAAMATHCEVPATLDLYLQ